jgi:hypothetical protein
MNPTARWFLSQPAAMFYCLTATWLHRTLGSPSGLLAFAELLASIFFVSSMALWVLSDARRRQRSLPYDFGSFVFFAWPLVVPIYLISTRGWRAFATLGLFVLLYLAAALFSAIVHVLHSVRVNMLS